MIRSDLRPLCTGRLISQTQEMVGRGEMGGGRVESAWGEQSYIAVSIFFAAALVGVGKR
jgi:hypothetical protein